MKQQSHILQLSEALGSAFSLFEKQAQALSVYHHFHSFFLLENTTLLTETTLNTALDELLDTAAFITRFEAKCKQ